MAASGARAKELANTKSTGLQTCKPHIGVHWLYMRSWLPVLFITHLATETLTTHPSTYFYPHEWTNSFALAWVLQYLFLVLPVLSHLNWNITMRIVRNITFSMIKSGSASKCTSYLPHMIRSLRHWFTRSVPALSTPSLTRVIISGSAASERYQK